MTNDKKNINSLVSDADDDPTAELEIIRQDGMPLAAEDDLESEASTYDYDDVESGHDDDDIRIVRLREEVRLRDESIDRMQFDIEQLRARWNGLDKEIRVREKLTDKLNAELKTTKTSLTSAEQELSRSQSEVLALEQSLREQTQSIKDEQARSRRHEEHIQDLEQKAKLHDEEKARLVDIATATKTAEAEILITAKNDIISELSGQIDGRDQQIISLSAELNEIRRELDDTQANLVQLRQTNAPVRPGTNDNALEFDIGGPQEGTGEVGALVDNRQEVRELQAQLQRTESYADTLRNRLQDNTKIAEATHGNLEQTTLALKSAERQISELNELLEAERLETTSLQDQIAGLSGQFDQELRKIRFELGTAQQTITDHETVNEQLTSDLIDNQSFRQALESKLEQTETSAEKQLRSLRQKVKKLERRHSEDAHKISNKDNAIAALLNELASRSSVVGDVDDADEMRVHESEKDSIEKSDDRLTADRITRLLIGSIDGQELRFPLFKDRLTIGRTTQNDIHLKAQYISRRHALIVTENDHTRIVDWGSKNGILVNRKKVTEQVLKTGDIVTIGTADFRYEERPKR